MTFCSITQAPAEQTLLVFDKDGVLLDLNATWLPVVLELGQFLQERCGGSVLRDDLLAGIGVDITPGTDDGVIAENGIFAASTFTHMVEIWSKMEPKLAPIFENEHQQIRDIILNTSSKQTVPKGDVKASLERLAQMGFTLAVATNDSIASTEVNLDALEISELFHTIICADSGFGRKPEGGGLLEACRASGIPPARAIMIGDTLTDFMAAEDAGFKGFITIADSAPKRPEFIPRSDLVVKDIAQMPQALT